MRYAKEWSWCDDECYHLVRRFNGVGSYQKARIRCYDCAYGSSVVNDDEAAVLNFLSFHSKHIKYSSESSCHENDKFKFYKVNERIFVQSLYYFGF